MEENQLTYEQFIQQIIESRGRHGCGDVYHERHHIKPKCLGGDNSSENMIDLFAREHFIAHQLLAKEHPHDKGLQFAWWMMSSMSNSQQERYKCTAEEYEEAKTAMAKAASESMSGKNNPSYGKTWHMSEEAKEKIRLSHMGANNPNYGKFGEDNPFYGKHHSEESKRKMSEHQPRKVGSKNPNAKPVFCIERKRRFWGAKEAGEKMNISPFDITSCCTGKRKTAGGYHWRYVKEYH